MAGLLDSLREAQRLAATATGREVVVTAGAGTGKTTTLSARTLYLLNPEPLVHPTSIDRFLIITFTRNAAAEMRERIARQLIDISRNERTDPFWQTQRSVMHRAAISTLDSFCLDVLKTYAHDTDLDPEFQPMDADDAERLEGEAIKSVFENLYADLSPPGERFRALAASLGGRGYDGELSQRVRALHSLRQTQPHPMQWTERVRHAAAALARWRNDPRGPWFQAVEEQFKRELSHLEADANRAMHWAQRLGITKAYEEFLVTVLTRVRDVLQIGEKPLHTKFADKFSPSERLPSKSRSVQLTDEEKALIEPLIAAIRDRIKDIQRNWIPLVDPALDSLIGENALSASCLLDVVDAHAGLYRQRKAEERVADFADIEQLTFQLLDERESIRDRLRRRFEHVMVDEVQDINHLQDSIIQHAAASRRENLFLVGDVKQSIYGFRLAQPELLVNRLKRAEDPDDHSTIQRVDLKENFRSRASVVRAVNALFGKLMQREMGEIPYDERACLEPCAKGFPGEDAVVTLAVLENPKSGEGESTEDRPDGDLELLESAEREAIYVTGELMRLLGREAGSEPVMVMDPETREPRAIRQRDIAILLRSPRTAGEIFVNHLRRAGLELFAELGGGYLNSPEIRDIKSVLQTIENPRQDIPLAAYLTSAIGGATYSDLTRARRQHPGAALADSVRGFIAGSDANPSCQRLIEAMNRLEDWRRDAGRKSLPDLLWNIIQESGYLLYAGCQPLGAQRRANLLDFMARARRFCGFHTQGLPRFLRYVEHLDEREDRIKPPNPLSESDDVIRLMSVHASKGLEFPVVVLPQLGRRFNLRDSQSGAVIDRDFGPCLNFFVESTGVKSKSLPRALSGQRQRQRDMAEELRILYVALTRARERLIAVGSANWSAQPWKWCGAYDPDDEMIRASYLEKCLTPLDWLAPAAIASGAWFAQYAPKPDGLPAVEEPPVRLLKVDEEALPEIHDPTNENTASQESPDAPDDDDRAFADGIVETLRWRYPHECIHDLSAKASLTDLKRARAAGGSGEEPPHPAILPPLPLRKIRDFKNERNAARRGTVTHRFLERMDLNRAESMEALIEQRTELIAKQIVTEEEANLVDLDSVAWFLSTDAGKAMREHPNRVLRECPFTLAMTSGEVWPDRCGRSTDELVHVQGVIDAAIVRDAITVVDFKTDRVSADDVENYAVRYHTQLQLYTRAVAAILSKPVEEALLAFLTPRRIVRVPAGAPPAERRPFPAC